MRFLLIAMFLSGCAHFKPRIEIKEVEVPIAVPCLKRENVPPVRSLASKSLTKSDSLFTKTKAINIDLLGLKADDGVLRAILEGCIED
jgi:hypothetical protein